jgi:uncharacterized protein
MKIVIDSNVIVAAFATRGLCDELLELCLAEHSMFICDEIILEVNKALVKKIKVPAKIVKETMLYLNTHFQKVEPCIIDKKLCRDERDLMVLGTAEKASAEVILTGDKDLLVLKEYKNIKILTPGHFWRLLKT